MIPRVDYRALNRTVPVLAALDRLGRLDTALTRRGTRVVGPCPIHGGDNPRQFVVSLTDNRWHCFGDCDRGGSVIDLVALLERISIHDAAVRLAAWFALPPPHVSDRSKTMSGRPSHKVFVVEDRDDMQAEETGAFWTRVGSAWPHKDGKGLNIQLRALPLNGRLVLREWTEEDDVADKRSTRRAKS